MTRPLQIACTCAAGLAVVAGTGVLLVLARYSTSALVTGIALVVLGALVFVWLPAARRPAARLALALALLATGGGWALARFGGSAGPEPVAPTPHGTEHVDARASAEALAEGLRLARSSLATLDGIRDYTCTYAKRERARNLLGKVHLTDERMYLKVRHRPHSIYVRYEAPETRKGTEALYVEGRNEGRMIAHSTRPAFRLLGTLRLEPTEWMAMVDQRHPITRAGIRTFAEEILRIAEEHADVLAAAHVRFLAEQTIDGRPCRCLEVQVPRPHEAFPLALARVFFDEVWNVPVRIERWDYVTEDGQTERRLVEAYTATDLRFDQGLGDIDFDPANPDYGY